MPTQVSSALRGGFVGLVSREFWERTQRRLDSSLVTSEMAHFPPSPASTFYILPWRRRGDPGINYRRIYTTEDVPLSPLRSHHPPSPVIRRFIREPIPMSRLEGAQYKKKDLLSHTLSHPISHRIPIEPF